MYDKIDYKYIHELIELKDRIQQEFNEFVESDQSAELNDEELVENFWSNAIVDYNDVNTTKVGFNINNGIVELVLY